MENIRTHSVYVFASLLTVLAILFSVFLPEFADKYQLIIAGILIALVGIPHGATDYMIFKRLYQSELKQAQRVRFFTSYSVVLFSYIFIWIFLPVVAFILFLLLSMYHFGQSNWQYLKTNSTILKTIAYLSFGGFVIFVPVITHFDWAREIILDMTHSSGLELNMAIIEVLPVDLLIINVWLIIFFYSKEMIRKKDLFREIFHLILLTVLFYTTPLLIGFSIYFVVWHSASSVIDQINFIKKYTPDYNIIKYYKEASPMIILSFFGMGMMWYINSLGWFSYSFIGMFFIMIAVVTLPHMLLIEQLYDKYKNKVIAINSTAISTE